MIRAVLWIVLALVIVRSRVSLAEVYRRRRGHSPIPGGLLAHATLELGMDLLLAAVLLAPGPLPWRVLSGGTLLLVCGLVVIRRLQLKRS